MDSQSFPVSVLVKRPDGSSESVRVGTAVRTEDGFRLSLGELSIGAAADPAPTRARVAAPSSGDGMVFPPYGRSKGAPIAGASVQDLEFYISGSRRSLDDPSKSRWHDKERVLLAAMEAELARRNDGEGGGAGYSRDAGGGDFGREAGGAFGRDAGGGSYGRDSGGGFGRGAGGGSVGAEDFDVPPSSDDDIPF